MTFQETLKKHLLAVQQKDLQALAETVATDELVLVTADGRLVKTAAEFLDLHRDWFAMDHWSLEATPVELRETQQMGVAVLHLAYRETPPDRPEIRQESYLTLVFERRDDRWVMIQDQNTPIQKALPTPLG